MQLTFAHTPFPETSKCVRNFSEACNEQAQQSDEKMVDDLERGDCWRAKLWVRRGLERDESEEVAEGEISCDRR